MKTSIDIVIPIFNEEDDLRHKITELNQFLSKFNERWNWKISIFDNGSIDDSERIGLQLESNSLGKIHYHRMALRGRGRALSQAWTVSDADIVCYMDLDLSTNLMHFESLISAIDEKRCHLAIGSRLSQGSKVMQRSFFRSVLSKGYNFLIKVIFSSGISDAQCGFKAMDANLAKKIVPMIKDTGFFWDTELLLISSAASLDILEIPVYWEDDPDSRVRIINTIITDLRGLVRMRLGGMNKAAREIAFKPGK
tara:strand:+ start:2775 stop:3530 length:756 start_codon:yes stop_codon:yes gene_type:complete